MAATSITAFCRRIHRRLIMNPDHNPTLHLGVMAKFWEPGTVKTRLGKTIGLEKSAQLHQVFCRFLARRLQNAADLRTFVVTPEPSKTRFLAMVPPSWAVSLQSCGDLGRRMQMWFATNSFGEPPGATLDTTRVNTLRTDKVLIGADCLGITEGTIEESRNLLADHDVVLGPAVDGGYYLIGLREGWRAEYEVLMTDVDWGSGEVYEQTMARGQSASLRIATLETLEDVDTIDELDRLRSQLRVSESREDQELLSEIERVLSGGVPS